MALTQKLMMRQSQALVMTPQLMQAIKLLQLSNLDLAAYVEGELERNPFLEHAGDGEQSPAERERTMDTVEPAEANGRDGTMRNPPIGSMKISTPAARRSKRGSTPISRTFFPTTPATPARKASRTSRLPPTRTGDEPAARVRTATTISKPSSPPN